MGREFKAPWFNCLSPGVVPCCYAYLCGCCAVADISKAAGTQENWFFDCMCVSAAVLRNRYRKEKGVNGYCGGDCCLSLVPCCALSQMISDLEADFKMLNVTADDLKQSFGGMVDAAQAEKKAVSTKVQGSPASVEMTR
eukprot:c24237_g1_i1.p1 GENE.c24237_g1_i1~~c24237_g1_i1.p1  ORF type:complete len:147 (-),score=47.20 c24237_g1_i1:110-526(-)